MLNRVWNWLAKNFILIERFVLTIAAVLAIFPLFEWWSERDDRRLDRAARLLQASMICRENHGKFFDIPETSDSNSALFDSRMKHAAYLYFLCFEITEATINDPDATDLAKGLARAYEDFINTPKSNTVDE